MRSRSPSMLSAAVCPCRSATTQCSTRMASPVMPIRPARDVAGGEDSWRARFEKRVDDDAAIDLQASRLGEAEPRAHAEAGDDEIGLEDASAA